jgi:pimeloyl-ACP methyl ester carboxylesterase
MALPGFNFGGVKGMSKALRGVTFLLVVVGAVVFGGGWYLSGMLLFRDKPMDYWQKPQKPACSPWMVDWAFADLRTESVPPRASVDDQCPRALEYPKTSHGIKASHGLDVHYNVFDNPIRASAYGNTESAGTLPPLFLHIHGVSGNWAHGARYFKMASRLGFQLVAMDLSNHGESGRDGKGAAYGCREDADVAAVVNDLKSKFPGRDLYLHATSMGAMSLLNAMPFLMSNNSDGRIVAITLENPIPSVREIVMKSPYRPPVPDAFISMALAFASWRAGHNFDTCRPLDSAGSVRVPTLVQWSEKDEMVPRELVESVVNALPADVPHRFETFPRGGHSAVWNGDPLKYEEQTLANWQEGLEWRRRPLSESQGAVP